jgi:DNA polymerase-3 subunit gamma/tau
MSDYIVTARKHRPMKFDDVAAQGHVTQTLKNAIKQKRLAHAYLFAGPRGVGKTTTARLLAKLVNCQNVSAEFEPDNACETCIEITEGRSFDVLEIDGASNRGVEEIRNLRESVRYAPAKGRYKVYIIDEVHMLTKEAFNALLKTLEEPPPHVMFIFATTEIHKLPATIISRCQRFDFRRIAVEEIIKNLSTIAEKEGIQLDEEALMMIAKKGDGSLRDSQSIFDQIVALCGKTITKGQILDALNIVDQDFYFRVTDLVKAKDAKGGLDLVADIMQRGYDIKEFLSGLTEHLRNLLTAATTGTTSYIEESDFYKKRYADVAQQFSVADILRLLKLVNATEAAIRWSAQPRFKLETDIVQMITMNSAAEVGDVLQRIEELSRGLSEKKKLPVEESASLAPEGVSGRSTVVAEPGNNPLSPQKVSARPTFSRPTFTKPSTAAAPRASDDEKPSTLSASEVSARWSEFVAEVRRQRIAVGTVLESAEFAGVTGATIRVRANDFTASAIQRNKELLQECIQQVFGARGRIEAEVYASTGSSIEFDATNARQGEPDRKMEDDHPVIQAMVRELGAEPL